VVGAATAACTCDTEVEPASDEAEVEPASDTEVACGPSSRLVMGLRLREQFDLRPLGRVLRPWASVVVLGRGPARARAMKHSYGVTSATVLDDGRALFGPARCVA
jgi:hypothetical protein